MNRLKLLTAKMSSLLMLASTLNSSYGIKTTKAKKNKKQKVNKIQKPIKTQTVSPTAMCRICYKQNGDIPIFNNPIHPKIAEDIAHFSGLTMDNKDNLPNSICQKCLELLNGCILFREMCLNTNEIITKMITIKEEYVEENWEVDNSDNHYDNNTPNAIIIPKWCPICDMELDSEKMLKKHKCKKKEKQNTEPGIDTKKTFLCDICGKVTASNASLLTHKTTHENVFPFKCEACPYRGRTLDLLKVHKRSHMVDKPYKCTQCPKATTSASNLQKHIRHVHSSNKPFKCTYCDKAFPFRHDVTKHIRDIHLRQSMVECDICFKKFNTRKILGGHRLKVHRIKSERQGRLPAYLKHKREQNMATPRPTITVELNVGSDQKPLLT